MSKKVKAQSIYDNMLALNCSNAEIEKAFVDMLDMTPAGAKTYRYNCGKASTNISIPKPAKSLGIQPHTTVHKHSTHKSTDDGRERSDTRPLYTACVVKDDIIVETFSAYDVIDVNKRSANIVKTASDRTPEINSLWSNVPTKSIV